MLKKIMNLHEETTHSRLRSVCEHYGALVYPKVRLADVFPIEDSGISSEDYRFALQSHFDFIVTDNKQQPLFAVEFDGNFHRTEGQKTRNIRKNWLCDRFKLPLLRINSNYLVRRYRSKDLHSWFVEVWFVSKGFYKAQEEGLIPYDESFDPFNIIAIGDRKEDFPLRLSREALLKIQKLHSSRACEDLSPSYFIGIDKEGSYRGIAYLRIDNHMGICTKTAMRSQQCPIEQSDAIEEVLICEIYEELAKVLKGQSKAQPLRRIDEKIKDFRSHHTIVNGLQYGVADSLAT